MKSERGAILITSLLLLLVLTVLGLAVMRMTRMQERMAGNSRDLSVAFQAAEAALRDGEDRLFAMTARPDLSTTLPCTLPQVCQPGLLPVAVADLDDAWWNTNGINYLTAAQEMADLQADPRFTIEEVGVKRDDLTTGHGVVPDMPVYQITARSVGLSGSTNTVLQSTYARPF